MQHPEPQLDELYREVVLDHYKNPRGRKTVESPHVCNEGFNPLCGDEVKIAIRLEGDRLGEVGVSGRGCSISVASGSMMAEELLGKRIGDARAIFKAFKAIMHGVERPDGVDLGDLEALEGVRKFPVRIKCALLPWVTLIDALDAIEKGTDRLRAASTTEEGEEIPAPVAQPDIDRPGIPCDPGSDPED